ncbi:MAG TPA: hypothetical protein VK154_15325 [Chitinophagales bacterium]|nr:hypothetical protein [Chitinophagales bacterium]
MADIVTLKELEAKYGWGFVLLRNPIIPEGYAYITAGEYLFHSQSKNECWDKFDDYDTEDELGIMPFGVNPKYENSHASVSVLSVVNEPIPPYKKNG